jgi:hypothetical protein
VYKTGAGGMGIYGGESASAGVEELPEIAVIEPKNVEGVNNTAVERSRQIRPRRRALLTASDFECTCSFSYMLRM